VRSCRRCEVGHSSARTIILGLPKADMSQCPFGVPKGACRERQLRSDVARVQRRAIRGLSFDLTASRISPLGATSSGLPLLFSAFPGGRKNQPDPFRLCRCLPSGNNGLGSCRRRRTRKRRGRSGADDLHTCAGDRDSECNAFDVVSMTRGSQWNRRHETSDGINCVVGQCHMRLGSPNRWCRTIAIETSCACAPGAVRRRSILRSTAAESVCAACCSRRFAMCSSPPG
jgi:hypothetical protein